MPMGISLKAEANASAMICKDNHPLHFFKAQLKSFLKVIGKRRKARERRAEGEDMVIKTERKSNTKNKKQRHIWLLSQLAVFQVITQVLPLYFPLALLLPVEIVCTH